MSYRRNQVSTTPLLKFLDECFGNMGENQKGIYYLATNSVNRIKSSPFFEKLPQAIEVLFLVEPTDEAVIQKLKSYKKELFVDICKQGSSIDVKSNRRTQKRIHILVKQNREVGYHSHRTRGRGKTKLSISIFFRVMKQ